MRKRIILSYLNLFLAILQSRSAMADSADVEKCQTRFERCAQSCRIVAFANAPCFNDCKAAYHSCMSWARYTRSASYQSH